MLKFSNLSITAFLVCLFLAGLASGKKEYGGKWTDKSKAEVAWKVIENLQTEQNERAERLEKHHPDLVPKLAFTNFPQAQGRQGERLLKKFLRGSLKGKARAKFLKGIHQNLQSNQDGLYAAEANAALLWKASGEEGENSSKEHTAEILGSSVTAIRLGVILDSSPSMKHVVEKLSKEIGEQFQYSYFVEVAGCRLNDRGTYSRLSRRASLTGPSQSYSFNATPWFFADPPEHLNPFESRWHSPKDLSVVSDIDTCYVEWPGLTRYPISAILAMTELLEVDTIYWFSDYRDKVDEKFAEALIQRMKDKKIRLYLVSNDRKPIKILQQYAEKSGGSFERKRVR